MGSSTDALRDAQNVVIFAGAGLSAEVGIQTYWNGDDSLYGGTQTEYGYTPLEHADAQLWMQDTYSQVAYFQSKRAEFRSINYRDSIYGELLSRVQTKNYFCVTSNVDSGFYSAGFDEGKLYEIHGSYRNSQCVMNATHGLFPVEEEAAETCKACGMPVRPNALFFNDPDFNPQIMYEQQDRFNRFVTELEDSHEPVVLLEIGVGDTIPRLRQIANRLYRDLQADYLHVNIQEEPEFLFGQSCAFPNKEEWLQMSAGDFLRSW